MYTRSFWDQHATTPRSSWRAIRRLHRHAERRCAICFIYSSGTRPSGCFERDEEEGDDASGAVGGLAARLAPATPASLTVSASAASFFCWSPLPGCAMPADMVGVIAASTEMSSSTISRLGT